jgi:proteasome lid subunit RPN8/RPN11
MKVILDPVLQQKIFAQMEASYPNEGGGFLMGTPAEDNTRVEDIIQVTNVYAPEEQHHRYAMTPQDWARLEDQAEARGLGLVGYYHSHPDSPAIPSAFDRDHALPNFIYVITSVVQGRAAEMRVWQLAPDRARFDEDALVIRETGGTAAQA